MAISWKSPGYLLDFCSHLLDFFSSKISWISPGFSFYIMYAEKCLIDFWIQRISLTMPRSLDVQASNSTSLLLKVKLFNFSLFHNLGRCASFEKEVKPGFFFSFKYLFLQLFIFISIPNHFLYHNFIWTLAGLQPRPVNKYFQVWSEKWEVMVPHPSGCV